MIGLGSALMAAARRNVRAHLENRNVRAHLEKLKAEGLAFDEDEHWKL
jgi:hypothetical protein